MREQIALTGMVLTGSQLKDYDKRLVILTKEKGKITAFANNVRKQNNSLKAACQTFTYGTFHLYPGYDSYTLVGAEVDNYFTSLQTDLDAMCYGMYFCEFADYLLLEGNINQEALKLLYATMRALEKKVMPLPLIKRVFELRMLAIEGQALSAYACVKCGRTENLLYFDGAFGGAICSECARKMRNPVFLENSTLYAVQYILSAPYEKLYAFSLKPEVFEQVDQIADAYIKTYVPKRFKSLDILNAMT